LAKASATDYDTTWVDQSGGGGGGALTISNKTAAYTVVAGDLGTIVNCTANTFTVSLTAAATLGAGFNCWIWNTGTGAITIDPSGAETIDGIATLTLRNGEGTQIVCDGTNWQTGDQKEIRSFSNNIASSLDRPVASGSVSIAIGAGTGGTTTTASGIRSVAIGWQAQAGNYQTALGVNGAGNGAQAVTGNGAMALGGSYASGADSFAAAVANNTSSYGAQGANSVAIGNQAKATSGSAVAIGASTSVTSNTGHAFGNSNTVAGTGFAIGRFCEVGSLGGMAIGSQSKADGFFKLAFASGSFVNAGDAQTGTLVLRASTTNSTATVLYMNNSASGARQVILPDNSAFAFTGIIVARRQASGGTESAAWKVEGLIRREANAGTTTLVASTVTAIDNTPGWTLALSADTTNGGLAVTATGAAATNIRWVATIQTSECTYA
jgi:hypothetical protein